MHDKYCCYLLNIKIRTNENSRRLKRLNKRSNCIMNETATQKKNRNNKRTATANDDDDSSNVNRFWLLLILLLFALYLPFSLNHIFFPCVFYFPVCSSGLSLAMKQNESDRKQLKYNILMHVKRSDIRWWRSETGRYTIRWQWKLSYCQMKNDYFFSRACVRKMYIHHISASEKRNRYFVSIDHFFSRVIGEMVIFFCCFFSWVRAAERRWLLFAHFSGPTMWREINNICTVCCVLFVCKTFSLWNHTPWFGRPISHTFCFWYICWNENCSLIRQQATTSTRTSFNFHKFECV